MGMTMAQKILARHSAREEVKVGDYIWANVDGTALSGPISNYKLEKVFDPERVYAVEDHLAPPPSVQAANDMVHMRKLVEKWGLTNFFEYGRNGIQHEIFPQYGYVSPGDLIASLDSHTTSYGCFNVASCPLFEEAPYVI